MVSFIGHDHHVILSRKKKEINTVRVLDSWRVDRQSPSGKDDVDWILIDFFVQKFMSRVRIYMLLCIKFKYLTHF